MDSKKKASSTERVRRWRQANPEKARAGHREWQRKNADKVREYNRRYWMRKLRKLEAEQNANIERGEKNEVQN